MVGTAGGLRAAGEGDWRGLAGTPEEEGRWRRGEAAGEGCRWLCEERGDTGDCLQADDGCGQQGGANRTGF